jgi:hypothetical protein
MHYNEWNISEKFRSEEVSASIIRVTLVDELGTTLALTSNRRTLRTWVDIYG